MPFEISTIDLPPGWYRLLFENHPTTEQRLGMVEAWKRRYATSAAQSP